LELWPQSPRGQASLAELLRAQERWEEAAACYDEAWRVRPRADLAHRAGWMLLETGQLARARKSFLDALEVAGQAPETGLQRRLEARSRVGLALVDLESGDPTAARALTREQMAPLAPDDPLRRLLEGAVGTLEGRRMALLAALEDEGPEAGTTHLVAWGLLSRLAEQGQDRVQALRCLAEALRLTPAGTPRAQAHLARFQALRQAELEAIEAREADNGLVFVADLLTGSRRAAELQSRKKSLEGLAPGPVGAGRRAPDASPVVWPTELEGDLKPVRAARDRREVQPPQTWLED